jgi:hypothetical protein
LNDHDIDIDDARFEPSPAEIAKACREIQAGWSDEERIKRRRVTPRRSADSRDVERIARESMEYNLARKRAAKAG